MNPTLLPPAMNKIVGQTRIFCFGMTTSLGGARGVIVIVVGNEHGDTSSNPGRNSLHFT